MQLAYIGWSGAIIVLQLLILRYLYQLEKIGCKCAMDWRRDFIMAYLVICIVLTIANMFLMGSPMMSFIPGILLVAFGWANLVITLQYVHRLKKEKCECSVSVYRTIMHVMAMIQVVLAAFTIALLIVTFTMMSFSRMSVPKLQS